MKTETNRKLNDALLLVRRAIVLVEQASDAASTVPPSLIGVHPALGSIAVSLRNALSEIPR